VLHLFDVYYRWLSAHYTMVYKLCLFRKVKFFHTFYQALGPELILVYRQSARRWLEAIHPAVGCYYFSPGLRLPSHSKSVTAHWPVPNYTAWWHVCEQLARGCYLEVDWPIFGPTTIWIARSYTMSCSTVKPNRPPYLLIIKCRVHRQDTLWWKEYLVTLLFYRMQSSLMRKLFWKKLL